MSQGERTLQERFNTTKRANAFYNNQMLDFLNEEMRHFISRQSFIFMSTSDGKGNCDSTFKAGEPGFVHIIDERQLMYPEYRGNGVMASLGNITENPHIGLLFMDFIEHHIGLHVNGGAEIIENDELHHHVDGRTVDELTVRHAGRAERWVLITVHEAYIHCSKHIPHFIDKKASSDWGTDDVKKKGGDFFNVKKDKR
jgi:predicted pyridoxine 5'-phosphate oxidase superfamily flavin-nucleotide-binding protein